MRILLAIARYDYGNRENGDSFEFMSWVDPLSDLGHEVEVFDTFDEGWAGDRSATGAALLEHASFFQPHLVLMMLLEDEVPMEAVDSLRRGRQVANWFADDTWRFFSYSRHIAHHFSWVVTTSRKAKRSYDRMPDVRAFFSPWGYNPRLFHHVSVEPTIDVGFVGQRYGRRARIIERLQARGVPVVARGAGWPGGRIESAALAAHFAATRINLSFLESSAGPFQRLGIRVRGATRTDRLLTRIVPPPLQLKARPFEITACGAFALTNSLPELEECFIPGREIGVFDRERDLQRAIDHFLLHEDERKEIAAAGARRSAAYSWPVVLDRLLKEAA